MSLSDKILKYLESNFKHGDLLKIIKKSVRLLLWDENKNYYMFQETLSVNDTCMFIGVDKHSKLVVLTEFGIRCLSRFNDRTECINEFVNCDEIRNDD